MATIDEFRRELMALAYEYTEPYLDAGTALSYPVDTDLRCAMERTLDAEWFDPEDHANYMQDVHALYWDSFGVERPIDHPPSLGCPGDISQ